MKKNLQQIIFIYFDSHDQFFYPIFCTLEIEQQPFKRKFTRSTRTIKLKNRIYSKQFIFFPPPIRYITLRTIQNLLRYSKI